MQLQDPQPEVASDLLLLRPREVARLESIDPATLWRHVKAGSHPRPIRVGPTVRFVKAEIDDYIARLMAARDGAQASAGAEVRHG